MAYSRRQMAILLTKITAAQNEAGLSYYKVRGLCFVAVNFTATIIKQKGKHYLNQATAPLDYTTNIETFIKSTLKNTVQNDSSIFGLPTHGPHSTCDNRFIRMMSI